MPKDFGDVNTGSYLDKMNSHSFQLNEVKMTLTRLPVKEIGSQAHPSFGSVYIKRNVEY